MLLELAEVIETENMNALGIEALSAGALLLLVYNKAFLEEFFYRGVMQNRLERVFGQRWAVLAGGFLFAITHVLLDIQALSGEAAWQLSWSPC